MGSPPKGPQTPLWRTSLPMFWPVVMPRELFGGGSIWVWKVCFTLVVLGIVKVEVSFSDGSAPSPPKFAMITTTGQNLALAR